jgi:hypothetical protein
LEPSTISLPVRSICCERNEEESPSLALGWLARRAIISNT